MNGRLVRFLGVVLICAASAQCGGSDGGPMVMSQRAIQKAASASGDAQTGAVGAALSAPLRVLVTLDGAAQQGATVTWAATGAGASVNPASSTTGSDGIATTSWTLGQSAGMQSATASLSGATGSPVSFTATAAPGAATALSISSGNNQSGTPNSTLSDPLKVKVGDQFGNGVAGVTVEWQVATGSASANPASSVTDAGGLAQTIVTLGGQVGSVTITATSAGLTGSPATFGAESAALPTTAAVEVGDNYFQSARNGSRNAAVDTIAVAGTVTWTWYGSSSHNVRSTGSPGFTSSAVMTSGTYSYTFTTAGTYTYDCSVHGSSMSGTVVVR